MKFPISVLNDLAKKLRSREVAGRYDELTAYSNALIHQNHSGNNPFQASNFTLEQFQILAGHSDLENYIPLPYARTHICGPSKTLQFNDLPPIVLEEDTDFFGIDFGMSSAPRWSIVAQGDDDKWYMLANENPHFFEPGELTRVVEAPDSAVRVGHAHIFSGHVAYELKNWPAVSLVLGDNQHPGVEITRHLAPMHLEPELDDDADNATDEAIGDDRESAPRAECEQVSNINFSKLLAAPESLLPFTISRETTWQDFVDYCQQNLLNHWDFTYKVPHDEDDTDAETADEAPAQPKRDQALILETLQDIERTFVADDVFEALGVKVPAEVTPVSVANVIGRLMTVENETVEVQLDEDEMQAQAKVMKVLNIEAIVKEVKELAKSKRTPKNIKAIAAKYA